MVANETIKFFGWLSVSITWLAVVILIYKWRGDKTMSISKHAAAHKEAYLMMLIVESIVLPMFFLFVALWVVPTFNLPRFFTVCVGIASTGLLLAAWIPDVKGRKGKIHSLSAYGAAILFVPASTVLYLSPNISSFARYFSLLVLVYEMSAIVVFAVFGAARNHHLYAQAAYIGLFNLSVLAVAYVR